MKKKIFNKKIDKENIFFLFIFLILIYMYNKKIYIYILLSKYFSKYFKVLRLLLLYY